MKITKIKFNYLSLYLLLIAFLCGYIKYALYVLFIVLFHEFGHVLITSILGYKIKSIEIFPFGGITKIDKPLNSPIIHDLLIASFGIISQIILLIISIIFHFDSFFIKVNITIMLFNLLPIIPLDGSKMVMELFCLFLSFKKALRLYWFCSIIFTIIYLFINYKYLLNNYLLCFLFVYKTYEVIKNEKIIYHKFILERCLYDDLLFHRIKNKNEKINNYQKDTKYYYHINNKLLEDKNYLINYYFNYL